jgi:hypothetical protein
MQLLLIPDIPTNWEELVSWVSEISKEAAEFHHANWLGGLPSIMFGFKETAKST